MFWDLRKTRRGVPIKLRKTDTNNYKFTNDTAGKMEEDCNNCNI